MASKLELARWTDRVCGGGVFGWPGPDGKPARSPFGPRNGASERGRKVA